MEERALLFLRSSSIGISQIIPSISFLRVLLLVIPLYLDSHFLLSSVISWILFLIFLIVGSLILGYFSLSVLLLVSLSAVAMNENGDYGIPLAYYTEDVSTKVVKIIRSYTGIVNKMVWRKY